MTRLFAAIALLFAATPASAVDLRAVELGRYANFIDRDSIARTGDVVSFRFLMVTPDDLEIAGKYYWGGWSYMDIDCAGRTADETGFQSIQAAGEEGPRTVDTHPGWPIASSSREAALADAACDGVIALERPKPRNVNEAVWWGRAWLAE